MKAKLLLTIGLLFMTLLAGSTWGSRAQAAAPDKPANQNQPQQVQAPGDQYWQPGFGGRGTDGTVYPGNIPTAPIYRAMAQTWQLSMRKWNATKNVSRLFLTGYRSGNNVACGADSTGLRRREYRR